MIESFNEYDNFSAIIKVAFSDGGFKYNLCFQLLKIFRQEAIDDHKIPSDHKQDILNGLIEYFEKNEEYEKCSYLQKISQEIEKSHGTQKRIGQNDQKVL